MLNFAGKELVEDIKKNRSEFYSTISEAVEKCKEVVNNSIPVLSWAAKVHFILCQTKKAITYKKAIQIGKEFGWQLKTSNIESAAKLLRALDLIDSCE